MDRRAKGIRKKFPLIITGKGLFAPTEELPIRSLPRVEQDVVALFNQMLSSGLVRGIHLLASSQYEQYDGLFRVEMSPPVRRFTRDEKNPLGVERDLFNGEEPIRMAVGVLEYKYSMDSLIEEFQNGIKNANDIGLAVAWNMGTKWRSDFRVVSCLQEDNAHHRPFHGVTHLFAHATSNLPAFPVIILEDLVNYLIDPEAEEKRQREMYSDEVDFAA